MQAGKDRRGRACGPRGAWTDELGEAFLALLRETGNARAAARSLGHRHLFNNRMRRDPEFRRDCALAAAEADARLAGAESPFLPPVEIKGELPPGRQGGDAAPEPMIRRTSNGRFQISHVRAGGWTSQTEADFLAHARATGNLTASARAVGSSLGTVYKRMEAWPAFAREVDSAVEEASIRLEYELIAYAHALLRAPGEPRPEGEPDVPFDPEAAMRILAFIDRRRAGRTTRGRRNGPPERRFEDAIESIMSKIEAIERHEAWKKEREERGGGDRDSSPPGKGGG